MLFDLLRRDHDRLRELLTRIADDGAKDEREELIAELHAEFALHAAPEEEVVYRALARDTDNALVLAAEAEHGDVRDLLGYLATLDPDDRRWSGAFLELRQVLEEHLELEEGEMFTALRERAGAEGLRRLGAEFLEGKRRQREELQSAA